MYKRRILILILLSFVVFSCSNDSFLTEKEIEYLENNKDLTVSLYGYYPPYQFESEKGTVKGVFVDFIDLIEEKINYKFKRIKYADWQVLFKDVQNGNIDLVIDLNKTKKRKKHLTFFKELFNTNYVIVTRENVSDNSIKSLRDLTFKTVVIPENYAIREVLANVLPNLNIVFKKDEVACLMALNDGKYDAYVGPKPIVNYIIRNKELDNLKIQVETLEKYRPTIAVQKQNKILTGIITKAINEISYTELNNLLDSWLLAEIKPWYAKTKFWIVLLTLSFIMFTASVLLNKYLKFKIEEQTKDLSIAVKKAKENERLKTTIIQNISHEIRTPMNGILGFSELLKKEESSIEEKENYIDCILESGKYLIQVIDNIFEISNLQVEQVNLNPSRVYLPEFFDKITSDFEPKARTKQNEIVVIHPENKENLEIFIDRQRLLSIINHLVDNAVKFTSKGKIILQYGLIKTKLSVEIIDTGIGIEENDKEVIFESFSHLEKESARQYNGLGLGLSIAKLNVKYLKGTLTFSSKKGAGTTFKISVPYTEIENQIPENNIEEKITETATEFFTILIAEDVEINYLLLNSILTQFKPYKFNILRAINGKEAIDICHKNTTEIDLVIMDIRMPVMDGYEATQIIKANYPSIPVIAHTAYSDDNDIVKALDAGCDIVIPKPVNHHDFTKVLESYILKKKSKFT